jgi:hypothetical protein
MSEIHLNKEDREIAQSLQKIMGGDDDFYETNNETYKVGAKEIPEPSTSSVGKTLADGNDMRRLLSDLLDAE